MSPTFLEVARRPKWIAGLLLVMLIAGVFAGLMQWQLSRTFNVVGVSQAQQSAKPLENFAVPGEVFPGAYDSLATAEVVIDKTNVLIVENRIQLRESGQLSGYWVIANSETAEGASLTLALGFSESVPDIARLEIPSGELRVTGLVEPSDPPREAERFLGSVALAELINIYGLEPGPSYPVYLIVQEGLDVGLERISIGLREQELEINWLTAFYAIEWLFFALAAFYLWWRLVQDQRLRESGL